MLSFSGVSVHVKDLLLTWPKKNRYRQQFFFLNLRKALDTIYLFLKFANKMFLIYVYIKIEREIKMRRKYCEIVGKYGIPRFQL